MKLLAAFPLTLVLLTSIAATIPARQLEIILNEGECVVSSTGSVHLEVQAKSISKDLAGATRITAPARLRVSASGSYTLTLNGSPELEVDVRAADSRMKALRVSGATIRFEGDATSASVAQARMIKLID